MNGKKGLMQESSSRLIDEYLVLGAAMGNQAAFDQLARRWHARLEAHAFRLTGERELARDAAQIGWSTIIRGLHRLEDPRAFPAWAFRIVSRACAGEIGSAMSRRRLAVAVANETTDASVDPVEPSQLGRLKTAIRQLPPGERAAIALYHFEELSVAEVAVALAVPAGTVKTRLMNARRKLRTILQGETP